MRRTASMLVAITTVTLGLGVPAAAGGLDARKGAALPTLTTPDFNGDGYGDLAVGVRGEDLEFPVLDSGAVNVLYGGLTGITTAGAQLWDQDSPGVEDVAELDDQFGYSLASGDFDADGFADLAVGARNESIGFETQAGAVNILYGTAAGLASGGSQYWHQDEPGILDDEESFDHFGASLAAGDFDGDGFADLAIGVPGEDLDDINSAGAVNVLFGSSAGLSADGNQFWSQDSPGIMGEANDVDLFGDALAAGDFGRGTQADLAIGVPHDDAGGPSAGAANVLYGTAAGLNAVGNQLFHQAIAGVEGDPELGDGFGQALAAANVGSSPRADLIVGVPTDTADAVNDAGAVHVLYGSMTGVTTAGAQYWHQDSPDVEGVAEPGDRFGSALTVANFGGGAFPDLAIGVPRDDAGAVAQAGGVNLLYGGAGGLTSAADQLWHQDIPGVGGIAESGDDFGGALAAANFGNGDRADLVVGAPDDAIGSADSAGALNVLYGAAAGLTTTANQFWTQDSSGVPGACEEDDTFGASLTGSRWVFVD